MTTQTTTVSAAENPGLANKLSSEALALVQQEAAAPKEEKILPPSDTNVELLAGLDVPFEGKITTAEIRELTGADEEAISKTSDLSKGLMLILDRAVVKLGDKKPEPGYLDSMLAGDREQLLLAIRKATFGTQVNVQGQICNKCVEDISISIDLDKDVEYRKLEGDREFTVDCKVGPVKVKLPTGFTQKALVNSTNKTAPELDTIVLKDCVLEINGNPVLNSSSVLNLSVMDRRAILNAISDRNPGPQLSEIKKDCPTCGSEVPLPLTLADLFQS